MLTCGFWHEEDLRDRRDHPPYGEVADTCADFRYWQAHFGHAPISELSLLSGRKRRLDLETPKGSFWRKAAVP
jgi:hypothetical protein